MTKLERKRRRKARMNRAYYRQHADQLKAKRRQRYREQCLARRAG